MKGLSLKNYLNSELYADTVLPLGSENVLTEVYFVSIVVFNFLPFAGIVKVWAMQ